VPENSEVQGDVSPAHREWVVKAIFTSFNHSLYNVVTLTNFPIVVVGQISMYSFRPRLLTQVGGAHYNPAVENCPQIVEQLHGNDGESAEVLCGLFPPRVARYRDLFPEGYYALYEKGSSWGIMALLVLVFVHRGF
jgi:hypothetical protein